MRTSLTMAHIWGIPIQVHWNWMIPLVLVVLSLALGYFPQQAPGWAMAQYWWVSLGTAAFFFASVLAHELGHAWVAQREGVRVNSITLFIFGGVAHIEREPERPGAEFRIVAAGPLTSMILAVIFGALALSLPRGHLLEAPAFYLMQVNAILALFNLMPGFPLDGGRILRSILWKLSRNFQRATRWAANAGIGIGLLFLLGGLWLMIEGSLMSGAWISFVGWYLILVAQDGYRQSVANDPTQSEGVTFEPAWGMNISGQTYALAHVFELRGRMAYAAVEPHHYSELRRQAVLGENE